MPGCEAVIEHVPVATGVTVEPATVQMGAVVVASVTGKPDVAVAVRLTGVASVREPGFANAMVCAVKAAGVTWMLCDTAVAAA